jgi:hypothetical protein
LARECSTPPFITCHRLGGALIHAAACREDELGCIKGPNALPQGWVARMQSVEVWAVVKQGGVDTTQRDRRTGCLTRATAHSEKDIHQIISFLWR